MVLTSRVQDAWDNNILNWNWFCTEFNLAVWSLRTNFLSKLFSIALSLSRVCIIQKAKLFHLLSIQNLGEDIEFRLALFLVVTNAETRFFSILLWLLNYLSSLDLLIVLDQSIRNHRGIWFFSVDLVMLNRCRPMMHYTFAISSLGFCKTELLGSDWGLTELGIQVLVYQSTLPDRFIFLWRILCILVLHYQYVWFSRVIERHLSNWVQIYWISKVHLCWFSCFEFFRVYHRLLFQ